MKYGVDVAGTRLDDLDKMVLADVKDMVSLGRSAHVLDAGCGSGGLSVALSIAGATVTAVDIDDYRLEVEGRMAKAELLPSSVEFIQSDISQFVGGLDRNFDVVVLQRVLHYLPYEVARQLLIKIRQHTSKLYLSVTGTSTAIASHYGIADIAIANRFAQLSKAGQELFQISAPLCLYNKVEIEALLTETGWQVGYIRVSDFGNVKVMAQK